MNRFLRTAKSTLGEAALQTILKKLVLLLDDFDGRRVALDVTFAPEELGDQNLGEMVLNPRFCQERRPFQDIVDQSRVLQGFVNEPLDTSLVLQQGRKTFTCWDYSPVQRTETITWKVRHIN